MSNQTPKVPPKWEFPKPTHDNVIVDGILRYPPTGIKVLVVGGGIAGYTTALECWRKGHTVQLLERNDDNSPIGMFPRSFRTVSHHCSVLFAQRIFSR